MLLKYPAEKITGRIFNAGYENHPVKELAKIVKNVMGDDVKLTTVPSDDNRSYHVSSEKMRRELGFIPKYTIKDAVLALKEAFDQGKLPDSLTDEKYFNIKRMQSINLV